VAFLLLAALLVWPFFAGALFLDRPQYVALWNAAFVAALVTWVAGRQGLPLRSTATRGAAAVLWGTYVLAGLFAAAAPREALQEVIKHLLYLLVFLGASEAVVLATGATRLPGGAHAPSRPTAGEESRGGHDADPSRDGRAPGGGFGTAAALGLILWAGVGLQSLVSLAAAVGLLPFEVVEHGRLFTLMQYPNSAGSVAAAAFLLGLGLAQTEWGRRPMGRAVLLAGEWALLVTVALAMSRGAWLVFPPAGAFTLLLWPRGWRLAATGEVAALAVLAAVAVPPLARAYGDPAAGTPVLAAGLLLSAALGWIGVRLAGRAARRRVLVGGAAVVVILALGLGAVLSGAVGDAPALLLRRLQGFSFAEKSVWERLTWSADALRIVADYPILGLGGGGWKTAFRKYQSYDYYSAEVHNDFLETAVETGVVGLAALAVLLGSGLAAAWRLARRRHRDDPGRRALLAGIAGATFLLVLHSALDFNLALGCVGVMLWALLGLIDGLDLAGRGGEATDARGEGPGINRATRRQRQRGGGVRARGDRWFGVRVGLVVIAGVFCLVTLPLSAAIGSEERAYALLAEGRREEAEALLARAARLDPWSAPVRARWAITLEGIARSTGRDELLQRAADQYMAAARLERLNPNFHAELGAFALRVGDIDTGLREIELALELNPFEPERYALAAKARTLVGERLLHEGEADEALPHLERALEIARALAERAGMVPAYVDEERSTPETTPPLALEAGKAYLLLGSFSEAADQLEYAHTEPPAVRFGETEEEAFARRVQAAFWLSVAVHRLGDTERAAALLAEVRQANPSADRLFQELNRMVDLMAAFLMERGG